MRTWSLIWTPLIHIWILSFKQYLFISIRSCVHLRF
jgi:hypothetical protein